MSYSFVKYQTSVFPPRLASLFHTHQEVGTHVKYNAHMTYYSQGEYKIFRSLGQDLLCL